MKKTRLVAFSDGVIAIIITIMVLDLKVPRGESFHALAPLIPVFLSYVLSFIYIAIYWNNHHHLLYTSQKISGSILWANMCLLFWLSLFPFATGWMGENHYASAPTAFYGVILFLASITYYLLQQLIICMQGSESILKTAIGADYKGKCSSILYLIGIAAAFWLPWISQVIYVFVASIWLIPDQRIEKLIISK